MQMVRKDIAIIKNKYLIIIIQHVLLMVGRVQVCKLNSVHFIVLFQKYKNGYNNRYSNCLETRPS